MKSLSVIFLLMSISFSAFSGPLKTAYDEQIKDPAIGKIDGCQGERGYTLCATAINDLGLSQNIESVTQAEFDVSSLGSTEVFLKLQNGKILRQELYDSRAFGDRGP